jgi:hypothetical protein
VSVSNGTVTATATVNASGSFKVVIDLGLTNHGVHTLSVTQSVGVHISAPRSVMGLFRPGPPILNAPNTITSTDVTFQGRCAGAGWEVTITGTDASGIVSANKTACDERNSFSATLKLAYGRHTLSATQFNGVIQTSPSNNVVVDVPVPVPVVSTDPDRNSSTRTQVKQVLVMGNGVPGATLNVFVSVNKGPPILQQTITVDSMGLLSGSITLSRSTNSRETQQLTFSQKVGGVTSDLAKKSLTITFQ